MFDLKPKSLKFNRDVMRSVRRIIPDNSISKPESIYLARQLLTAYLLCQINSWAYPYSAIYRYVDGSAVLTQGIREFLEKSFEVRFSFPEKMEEGILYIIFYKETKSIAYAVMDRGTTHTGEIVEEKYKPLKNKLNRRGCLSLREVNFLIETIVAPRNHLPYFSEVHDPLSLHYFGNFLESDYHTQREALKLLSHLAPFNEFGFESPTELVLEPLCPLNQINEIEEIIARHRYSSNDDLIKKIEK